jgi:Na+:H+ antiporter
MPSTGIVITGFLGIALAASLVSRRTRTPYTVVLVLLGLGLAASSVSALIGVNLIYSQLIGGGLFVGLVLPPLLFESMMNVRPDEFRSVSRPSLLLATVGVVIATGICALLLWELGGIPLYSALLFATVIAPTDVATVMEIFRRVKVPSRLSTLMETEAAFNDATGIALFSVVLAGITASAHPFVDAVTGFVLQFGGGVLVGLGVSYGARYIHKLVSDPLSETILTIATVYGSYTLAANLQVSGLIAVAIAGLSYGSSHRTRRIQGEDSTMVTSFWTVLAFVANTLAFLYIGLSTNVNELMVGLVPILLAFLAVTVARFASVHAILDLKAVAGERFRNSWKNVAVLGGMRGALSIVLVASLPDVVPARDQILTMTLGVAFISITVQGFLLTRYASRSFAAKAEEKPAAKEPAPAAPQPPPEPPAAL